METSAWIYLECEGDVTTLHCPACGSRILDPDEGLLLPDLCQHVLLIEGFDGDFAFLREDLAEIDKLGLYDEYENWEPWKRRVAEILPGTAIMLDVTETFPGVPDRKGEYHFMIGFDLAGSTKR